VRRKVGMKGMCGKEIADERKVWEGEWG